MIPQRVKDTWRSRLSGENSFVCLQETEWNRIPWHNNWMERLMGEIAKRMKNRWMSWSAKGAKNLLNLLLRRYAEKDGYESFYGVPSTCNSISIHSALYPKQTTSLLSLLTGHYQFT